MRMRVSAFAYKHDATHHSSQFSALSLSLSLDAHLYLWYSRLEFCSLYNNYNLMEGDNGEHDDNDNSSFWGTDQIFADGLFKHAKKQFIASCSCCLNLKTGPPRWLRPRRLRDFECQSREEEAAQSRFWNPISLLLLLLLLKALLICRLRDIFSAAF